MARKNYTVTVEFSRTKAFFSFEHSIETYLAFQGYSFPSNNEILEKFDSFDFTLTCMTNDSPTNLLFCDYITTIPSTPAVNVNHTFCPDRQLISRKRSIRCFSTVVVFCYHYFIFPLYFNFPLRYFFSIINPILH